MSERSLFYIIFIKHSIIYNTTQFIQRLGNGLDGPACESPADVRHFLFSKMPRSVRTTRPASHVISPAGSFPEFNSLRGVNFIVYVNPSNVEFRNDWNCTSVPTINVHGTDRERFTRPFCTLQALSLLLQTTFIQC